jgi:hypothetical protein
MKTLLVLLALISNAAHGADTIPMTAPMAAKVLRPAATSLVSLEVHNNKASLQFLQLFDSKTIPANGATPLRTYPVQANTTIMVTWPAAYPLKLVNGVAVCNSSTATTKTLGSADCMFGAQLSN